MSVRVMAWVWDNGPEDQAELLVLLAVADFCNDHGECWPAMASIARKARLSERGARLVIRRLEARGYLETQRGGGRRRSSRYRIRMGANPERDSRNDIPGTGFPESGDPKPGTGTQKTRNLCAGEPSGTIREPSAQPRAREGFPEEGGAVPPPGADPEAAGAVPPSTEGAVPRLPGAVRALAGAVPPPAGAVLPDTPGADPDRRRRERLLAAVGSLPSGAVPCARLGGARDMAEADGWAALGLSLDEQCAVIAERMAAGRARDPAFRIRSFGYFTEAMRERAERRRAGVPPPESSPAPSTASARMAFYQRVIARHS